jgi:mycothiol synthase
MDGEGAKMSAQNNIEEIKIKVASMAEYRALNQHNNLIRLESQPDDPPIPLDEMIQSYQNIPGYLEVRFWCLWNETHDDIIGEGTLVLIRTGDNQHLAQFDISVLPEFRRQGWARRLLGLIADAAEADNRRLLITSTYDRVPGGESFMARLGAKPGLPIHINQLRLSELDQSLLDRWLELGEARLPEFELGMWDGPYPEDQLEAITSLLELTNQQPFGEIEIEDMHMTPAQLRQAEQQLFARGSQRWTYYLIEKASGRFAGYTETTWNPNRPDILNQDMTGVFPEYRNQGLGRWLKAAMLAKVLRERPQVKFVRTGNADVNKPMLKINTELGFKPYMASIIWQAEINRIRAYLGHQG